MTVDWTPWMRLTPAQQEALWREYRDIVRSESEHARATNYRAMNAALAGRAA